MVLLCYPLVFAHEKGYFVISKNINMKTLIISFGLVAFIAISVMGQSLERQVIGSAGGYDVAGGVSLSFTIGEPVVETAISGSVVLTQGFQQPDDIGVGIKEEIKIKMDYTVYPNPTENLIFIEMTTEEQVEVKITLVNTLGQTIDELSMTSLVNGTVKETMDLSLLAAANYILVMSDLSGNVLESFKIKKTR